MTQPVVVGVADHGGWAILVSVAANNGQPVVIDRRRVTTIDEGVPSQPYHHDTLTMDGDEAEALLAKVKRSVASCTSRAFDQLSRDLGSPYQVEAITIRVPPLERLPPTTSSAARTACCITRRCARLRKRGVGRWCACRAATKSHAPPKRLPAANGEWNSSWAS
jgi:hypothetical protein